MGNISRKDGRARLAERARRPRVRGPKFDVFGMSNPELRTSDRAFPAGLAVHASRIPRCGACCIDSLG